MTVSRRRDSKQVGVVSRSQLDGGITSMFIHFIPTVLRHVFVSVRYSRTEMLHTQTSWFLFKSLRRLTSGAASQIEKAFANKDSESLFIKYTYAL